MSKEYITNVAKRNVYRILEGKTEEQRSPEKPKRRWVNDNKMDLEEIRNGLIWLKVGTGERLL
jgi:hypothetical protein